MTNKNKFLPEVNYEEKNINNAETTEIIGDSKCPCCGYLTIPNNGDVLSYICPVCMWEIDLFINSDDELSDLNNGLSLKEARKNFKQFGAVFQNLKQYCRQPNEYE